MLTGLHLKTLCPNIIGITATQGVILVLDGDTQTERLKATIQFIPMWLRRHILAATEHDGSISFIWGSGMLKYKVPQEVDVPDGDIWSVYQNFILNGSDLTETR